MTVALLASFALVASDLRSIVERRKVDTRITHGHRTEVQAGTTSSLPRAASRAASLNY